MQNIFGVWEFKRRMFENLNFAKTGFKTCVLEKYFISYSCILFHIFNVLRSFFKNQVIFSKMLFFQNFDWFNMFFDQSKLHLKFFVSLCLFRSIEKSWISFLKSQILTYSTHFSKALKFFSLSPIRTRLHIKFLLFSSKIFARFSSLQAGMSILPFLFRLFSFFLHAFFHALKGYFWTMHKLGFLMF